jgi:hypothetical protein
MAARKATKPSDAPGANALSPQDRWQERTARGGRWEVVSREQALALGFLSPDAGEEEVPNK